MPHERLRPRFTFTEERLAELKGVVPEAFADGKVNWEVLRELLGDALEDEAAGAEHFGLTWPGKQAARRLAAMPSRGTLMQAPGEGHYEKTTKNLFVEGDNLEVLKLLQKAYVAQVKLIYIDPPYNTGNDFVYKDNFTDPLGDYLRKTSQLDESGNPSTTNTRADGRFHSNWLSMLYPRLRLARELLTIDGSIWISIDDGEVAHLRAVCNELFGEENFVATFIWQKRTTRENRRVFSFNHDYIVCYARDKAIFETSRNLLPLTEEARARYANPDNDPRGPWQSVSLNAQAGHATPAQFYTIVTPGGRRVDPPPGRCWLVTKPRYEQMVAEHRIWFGESGNNVPRQKVFLSEAKEGLTPHTLWESDEVGTTDSAKKELTELFGGKVVFDTPKPVSLIRRVLQIASDPDCVVMDFFAGSATTAHAVVEENAADHGKRRWIMVQMPEPTPPDSDANKSGFQNVCEIGKERMRRVLRKAPRSRHDGVNGFRVYQLAPSSLAVWEDVKEATLENLELAFERTEHGLRADWEADEVLTEVMLLSGFPLDSELTVIPGVKSNHIVAVTSVLCNHRLLTCFDKHINRSTLEHMGVQSEDIFVCLDSALTDEHKLQLADRCTLKTI